MLDGIRPDVLRAAIRDGNAPNLGALAQRGEAVWDAVSVFPSITPAATAAIATGEAPARSGIVGHAWYDEDERRVVVYGAMTETASQTASPLSARIPRFGASPSRMAARSTSGLMPSSTKSRAGLGALYGALVKAD